MYRYISTIIILVGLASVAYAAPVQVRCQPEPCQIHMNINLTPGGSTIPPIVPPPIPGNPYPVVSAIGYDVVDRDTVAPGLQVYTNTTVQYTGVVTDTDAITWSWRYTENGGPEITTMTGTTIPVPTQSFTYTTAPKTYIWTLRATDTLNQMTQSTIVVEVITPPSSSVTAVQNICPSTLAQEFHMLPVDGDVYQLQSVTNQLCLEENGSSVGLQTCSAGDKQNFHIIESPSPLIVMGKCLGVLGNSKDEGAAIDLSTCVGSAAQELTYARNVIGRATFKFGHSRQCITLQ